MKLRSTPLERHFFGRIESVRASHLASIALLSHDPESDRALNRSGASMHVSLTLLVGNG